MALVIAGRIVPLDRADPDAVFTGRVFLDDSGTIERVTAGNAPSPSGFAGAPVVDVGDAVVLPGLIDLHNHIGYNALSLWTEPKQKVVFAYHDSWTRAASYQAAISWPANALGQAAPEALLAHVQLRALVGGTTAMQGWRPRIASTCRCYAISTMRPREKATTILSTRRRSDPSSAKHVQRVARQRQCE